MLPGAPFTEVDSIRNTSGAGGVEVPPLFLWHAKRPGKRKKRIIGFISGYNKEAALEQLLYLWFICLAFQVDTEQ